MYFTRIASVFAVVATLSTLVLANPVPSFEKRQDTSSIEGVLNTLKSSTDSVLPQISAYKFSWDEGPIANFFYRCPRLRR